MDESAADAPDVERPPLADPTDATSTPELPAVAVVPLALVSGLTVLVLLVLAPHYGYFRDELYFLAAGRHLAWGYPDQGVLTPALARVADELAQHSLLALRTPAALLTGVTVLAAGLTAREVGGGRLAQLLAAVAVATGTLTLLTGHLLATSTADLTVWVVIGWLTTRLLRTRDTRLWLVLGAVCGLGLTNKDLPLALAGATVLAIAIDPGARRLLASGWLAAGAGAALLAWAPGLVWQARHGWPQVELAGQIRDEYGVLGERIGFLAIQLTIFSVGATLVMIPGIWMLLRDKDFRAYRPLVWIAAIVLVVFIVTAGQVYYPAGAYVPLIAAGAVALEARGASWRSIAIVVATAALLFPAALPLLPATTLADSPWSGLGEQQRESVGWTDLVDQVAGAYESIPAAERASSVVFTSNYGEAGAVDELGAARGLPAAYSGHNGYGLWGPPPQSMTGPVVVVAEGSRPDDVFDGCDEGRKVTGPVPNEERDEAWIYVCEGPRGSWGAVWAALEHLSS
ncbi:glycosyltransferase family 39 protein [Angustibacter luteus]|uniref:Glycosyltransferase family 39 protein n=1 Tax=Angustibacter luteus TaxID=658456 RepID=A0ABW1JJP6_9ACTN